MNKTSAISALLGTLAVLSASPALAALGSSTTAGLKCIYKATNVSTDPEHLYQWAVNTQGVQVKISGNYWKDIYTSYKNVFVTATTQDALKAMCQTTFTRKGVTQPLLMMSAGNPTTQEYLIWTKEAATTSTKISKVIPFGDSVSDTHNVYNASRFEAPSPHSYVAGRFSNGKVWNEYLTDALKLPNYNWAVGGAAGDDYFVVPGVTSQVQAYLDFSKNVANYKPANTLFTVFVGANDLINYDRDPDTNIAPAVKSALLNLINNGGARNLLIFTVPDLSRAPKLSDALGGTDAERTALRTRVNRLNTLLQGIRTELHNTYGTRTGTAKVNIQIFDSAASIGRMLDNHTAYGFTDNTRSCLLLEASSPLDYAQTQTPRPECTDGDKFIFWDLLHPTTRSHKLMADEILPFVRLNFPMP